MNLSNQAIGFTIGSGLLSERFSEDFEQDWIQLPDSEVPIYRNENSLVIQRHQSRDEYIPPHRINHSSHFRVFQKESIQVVIGIQSVGSLKESILPGNFVVPHDFFYPWQVETQFEDERGHRVPEFDESLREGLIEQLGELDYEFDSRGVYCQTNGPRFETPAEAKMLSDYGDVVGMTAASELIMASELDIDYATVCSVDNFVNGINEVNMSMERFEEGVRQNRKKVRKIFKTLLKTARRQ